MILIFKLENLINKNLERKYLIQKRKKLSAFFVNTSVRIHKIQLKKRKKNSDTMESAGFKFWEFHFETKKYIFPDSDS